MAAEGEANVTRILGWLFWIFLALYVLAIVNFAAMILGVVPFGSPLGSLLVWLGMPWVNYADRLPRMAIFGFGLSFWGAMLAPLVNLLIIFVLKKIAGRAG